MWVCFEEKRENNLWMCQMVFITYLNFNSSVNPIRTNKISNRSDFFTNKGFHPFKSL